MFSYVLFPKTAYSLLKISFVACPLKHPWRISVVIRSAMSVETYFLANEFLFLARRL